MVDVDAREVAPAGRIEGIASVPGDKSISHRLAMIGALSEGSTVIHNFAESLDCQSTLGCLTAVGVPIDREGATVTIHGRGLKGLKQPADALDAGNSGTTVRLMSGILAGFPFEATFVGDESLSLRPMKRIIEPLRRFGAVIEARDDNFLPLKIRGGPLFPVSFTMPIASAQVKSAVLLAGLQVRGISRVREPAATRNHTEIALGEFGARIMVRGCEIEIDGGRPLHGKEFSVPGDMSSAAFLIAAAAGVPGSRLQLTGVGLNPTRAGFLNLLQEMGGRISVEQVSGGGGELAGNIIIESSELAGMEIGGTWIPNVIDEIPILAVLGTRTEKGIRIRDAGELRAKESDRIRAVALNIKALGGNVEEYSDGLFVPGGQRLRGGKVDSFGDHRIAMAFAIAGLLAEGPVAIQNASCVDISFPGFFELLDGLRKT
jgi:3-phosphoshikimate 1-carboxyvinyltransferase